MRTTIKQRVRRLLKAWGFIEKNPVRKFDEIWPVELGRKFKKRM